MASAVGGRLSLLRKVFLHGETSWFLRVAECWSRALRQAGVRVHEKSLQSCRGQALGLRGWKWELVKRFASSARSKAVSLTQLTCSVMSVVISHEVFICQWDRTCGLDTFGS